MFTNTIKMLQDSNKRQITPRKHNKVIYVNKYDTLSSDLDNLQQIATQIKDIHEKKLIDLSRENVELKKENEQLKTMNNDLIETYAIDEIVQTKKQLYVIQEEE